MTRRIPALLVAIPILLAVSCGGEETIAHAAADTTAQAVQPAITDGRKPTPHGD